MLKEIFTWWNGQTLGTRISTYFYGQFVMMDDNYNKFYRNKSDTRRWVIYKGEVEATKVSPEWNNWLRFTSLNPPLESDSKHEWQIKHKQNQTGTKNAYSPNSSRFNQKKNDEDLDYEKWNPVD